MILVLQFNLHCLSVKRTGSFYKNAFLLRYRVNIFLERDNSYGNKSGKRN